MSEVVDPPIFVTRPSLPPLEELLPYLEEIWGSRILTNGGPLHQRLEEALAEYLQVRPISLFNNATIALMVALRALDAVGEVITTPFSFAATAHAIRWSGSTPVFVDIDATTFNLDPEAIEAAITPRTIAIMPVHCYGRPCSVERIRAIAEKHGLAVIYDAAHAFGVKLRGASLLQHGDFAVLSFHATKVFNTFEGGAIVCRDDATKARIDRLKNFGIVDEDTVDSVGLNGKMNELQAAIGILQLRHVDEAIRRRRLADRHYRELLAEVPGVRVPPIGEGDETNAAYFPVLIGTDFAGGRDAVARHLKRNDIFSRKYFAPLLSELPMYRDLPSAAPPNLPNANSIVRQVLCLPIYPELSDRAIERIVDCLRTAEN